MSDIKKHSTVKGAICIVFSAFFFALMGLFVQLAGDLPSFQKSFFRNAVAAIIAFIILIKEKEGFRCYNGALPSLILRSLFGTIGVLCNFYALDHLILSDALMLNKLSPFFAIIFSFLLLRERIKPFQLMMVFIAFIGSLFIIKPTPQLLNPASIMGLIGGICAGAAYTMVRKASQIGERKSYIVFFFSAFSTISLIPFVILTYAPMTYIQLLYLLLAGITAALGQFTITAAYSYAPASEISLYDYTQVVFTTLMSLFIFGTLPDIYSVIGYVVIISATVIMFIKNKREMA